MKHKQGRRTGRRRRRRRRTKRYNYEQISSSKVFPERDFSGFKTRNSGTKRDGIGPRSHPSFVVYQRNPSPENTFDDDNPVRRGVIQRRGWGWVVSEGWQFWATRHPVTAAQRRLQPFALHTAVKLQAVIAFYYYIALDKQGLTRFRVTLVCYINPMDPFW